MKQRTTHERQEVTPRVSVPVGKIDSKKKINSLSDDDKIYAGKLTRQRRCGQMVGQGGEVHPCWVVMEESTGKVISE